MPAQGPYFTTWPSCFLSCMGKDIKSSPSGTAPYACTEEVVEACSSAMACGTSKVNLSVTSVHDPARVLHHHV